MLYKLNWLQAWSIHHKCSRSTSTEPSKMHSLGHGVALDTKNGSSSLVEDGMREDDEESGRAIERDSVRKRG